MVKYILEIELLAAGATIAIRHFESMSPGMLLAAYLKKLLIIKYLLSLYPAGLPPRKTLKIKKLHFQKGLHFKLNIRITLIRLPWPTMPVKRSFGWLIK